MIKITPAAPLVPYMASELASFKTSIDSTSFTFKLERLKSVPAINPSITNRGLLLPLIELIPLILITAGAPGSPLVETTFTPAALP